MHLIIFTETVDRGTPGSPGPSAAAVVVRDERTGRTMLEGGFFFGDAPEAVADCKALVRCIELASDLGAEQLQLVHRSKAVVAAMTGDAMPEAPGVEDLIDEAQMKLLRFDSWLIREAGKNDLPRGGELLNEVIEAKRDIVRRGEQGPGDPADQAEDGGESSEAAESRNDEAQTSGHEEASSGEGGDDGLPPWPSWDVQFVMEPGDACPAPAQQETRFHFGPTVPADLCMYAACDILNDGPIDSPRRYPQESTIECRRCGVLIHLQRRDEVKPQD